MLGDIAVTGTRGWRIDNDGMGRSPTDAEESSGSGSDKILRRELGYLESGLKSIPESAKMKIVMLHYPPFDEHLQPDAFAELLVKYSVDVLVYGHVHLGCGSWLNGDVQGVQYHIVSADVVDFTPQVVVP